LLTLAQLQPDRFEGGWITVKALARCTTIGVDLPNVRRALDRARVVLAKLPALKTRSDTRGRKTFMCLVPPVPSVVLKWLEDTGRSYLLPGPGEANVELAVTANNARSRVSDAMGEILYPMYPMERLSDDIREIASRRGDAEMDAHKWTHEARLLLAAADVVLGGSGLNQVRQMRSALESHLTRMSAEGSHNLIVAEAQCAIALARCVLRDALLTRPTWPLNELHVSECREWLSRAAPLLAGLPHRDRGDEALLGAALTIHDASTGRVSSLWACDAIEQHLGRATECFRLARDSRGLIDVLVLRAEMVFHMFIREPEWPHEVHAHVIRDAFSIATVFAELVGRPDAWVIARARAVMLKIAVAVRGFRGDERASTTTEMDEAAREILSLGVLATESTRPYVSHAREFLRREASALRIELPTLDAV